MKLRPFYLKPQTIQRRVLRVFLLHGYSFTFLQDIIKHVIIQGHVENNT